MDGSSGGAMNVIILFELKYISGRKGGQKI